MLALLSLLPRPLVTGGLVFILGFACGQVTAYRVLVHAPRPQKEQRLAHETTRRPLGPAAAHAPTDRP